MDLDLYVSTMPRTMLCLDGLLGPVNIATVEKLNSGKISEMRKAARTDRTKQS